ncbi:unnamed protein product, partial [marine sediment metagenome]
MIIGLNYATVDGWSAYNNLIDLGYTEGLEAESINIGIESFLEEAGIRYIDYDYTIPRDFFRAGFSWDLPVESLPEKMRDLMTDHTLD